MITGSERAQGTTLLIVASAFFASSGPLAKPAMIAGLTSTQVVSVRIGLAAVILLAGVAVLKPGLLRVRARDWRLLAGFGLFGVVGAQTMYFAAVSKLPVGVAMLLEFMAPVLVALWVRFVRGTILPAKAWLGTAMALAGLAMVAQVWDGLRLDVVGVLAGIGAALCAACYFLVGERAMAETHPLTAATWGMVIGAVAIAIIGRPWEIPGKLLVKQTSLGPVWILLVAVAVLSTTIAYVIGMMALKRLPSNVASVLALAEPVFAIVIAWVLLAETLSVVQIIGSVTLLVGAFVVQRASQPKAESGAPKVALGALDAPKATLGASPDR
ncbi:drug/metabolite transporter (DMT)-like permease [Kibdelosporangium banguiense]|uniref:Drug/metabolite transporter (DMT)-like permease n=1 Tax=Kibdelosporangium banguiense TaxID=1365924 RepID=A0ABS4TI44_9PSEU|nr:EamA family transporter [Kibdelosporangium banguiense]MBP2323969.1 drug/metabolite transporter (DMT)-like permease [Kibdelosporangium banguiense]